MNTEPLVFNRYTERNLEGGTVTFDASNPRYTHIRFNVMACRMIGIDAADNVEFVKIGDEWFVCKTSLKRGYKVASAGGSNGYRVNAKLFVTRFISEIKYSSKVMMFKVEKTNYELAAQTLFKICHTKPLK